MVIRLGLNLGLSLIFLDCVIQSRYNYFPFVNAYSLCISPELCAFFSPLMTHYIFMIRYSNSWTTVPPIVLSDLTLTPLLLHLFTYNMHTQRQNSSQPPLPWKLTRTWFPHKRFLRPLMFALGDLFTIHTVNAERLRIICFVHIWKLP